MRTLTWRIPFWGTWLLPGRKSHILYFGWTPSLDPRRPFLESVQKCLHQGIYIFRGSICYFSAGKVAMLAELAEIKGGWWKLEINTPSSVCTDGAMMDVLGSDCTGSEECTQGLIWYCSLEGLCLFYWYRKGRLVWRWQKLCQNYQKPVLWFGVRLSFRRCAIRGCKVGVPGGKRLVYRRSQIEARSRAKLRRNVPYFLGRSSFSLSFSRGNGCVGPWDKSLTFRILISATETSWLMENTVVRRGKWQWRWCSYRLIKTCDV